MATPQSLSSGSDVPAPDLQPKRSPRSYWRSVWYHLTKKRLAMAGLCVTILLFIVAIFAPLLANDRPILFSHKGEIFWPIFSGVEPPGISTWRDIKKEHQSFILQRDLGEVSGFAIWPPVPYSPTEYNLLDFLSPPSPKHWLGTDDRGRDVLSRMIHGARISLSVGFVAQGIALSIGILTGCARRLFRKTGRHGDQPFDRDRHDLSDILSHHHHHRLSSAKHLQYHDRDRLDGLDRNCPVCSGRVPQAQKLSISSWPPGHSAPPTHASSLFICFRTPWHPFLFRPYSA
jgi:hypothetical protein